MLLLRIQTFLKSLFFHVYSGFPKSTVEEIQYRYSICLRCDHFDTKNTLCNLCGCNLSRKKEFFNKLAWADQECPDKRWPKITRRKS